MIRCEHARCPEQATTLNSRVDAIRDHLWTCDEHRPGGVFEPSVLPLPEADLPAGRPRLSLETVLLTWPPRHRSASKADAGKALRTLGVSGCLMKLLPPGQLVTIRSPQGSRFNGQMGQVVRYLNADTVLVKLPFTVVHLPFGRSELR